MVNDTHTRRRRIISKTVRLSPEAHLQYAIGQLESIQVSYRNDRLLVVAHRHKPESLALLRREVAHHLDAAHCAERPKQLPQDFVVGVWRQVVDKQAPAAAAAATTIAG